jgi:hypothetical protein
MTSPIVSSSQKGFIQGYACCLEYSTKANSIILDAVSNHKSLFALTIDLKDAFGSVPHKPIKRSFQQLGLPKGIVDYINDPNEGATTRIWKGAESTVDIYVKKGVRRECSLSPLLFNL